MSTTSEILFFGRSKSICADIATVNQRTWSKYGSIARFGNLGMSNMRMLNYCTKGFP